MDRGEEYRNQREQEIISAIKGVGMSLPIRGPAKIDERGILGQIILKKGR